MKLNSQICIRLFVVMISFLAGWYSVSRNSALDSQVSAIEVIDTSGPEDPIEVTAPTDSGNKFAEELVWSESGVGSAEESRKKIAYLVALAATDPLKALEYASKYMGRDSDFAMAQILTVWAKMAPTVAWEWTLENSPNHIARILQPIANVDPELGWRLSQEHAQRQPQHASAAYRSALRGILQSGDYGLALRFIEEADISPTEDFPGGKLRLFRTVIGEWVSYDPQSTLAWIHSLPDEGAIQKAQAEKEFLWALSTFDPVETLEYYNKIEDTALKQDAVAASLSELILRNTTLAADWIEDLGKGPELDRSMHELALSPDVLNNDVRAALEWAQSINNPEIREDGLIEIMAQWLLKNPDAAYKHFEETKLLSDQSMAMAERYAWREIKMKKKVKDYSEVY